jgi:hypothetical protein
MKKSNAQNRFQDLQNQKILKKLLFNQGDKLFLHAKELYEIVLLLIILSHPLNNKIRLQSVIFLLEDLEIPQSALAEMLIIEKNNPTLEFQFLIYSYRQIIKEKLMNGENEDEIQNDFNATVLNLFLKS